MKSNQITGQMRSTYVTLHVRVWIEIFSNAFSGIAENVTLHVRVWIEIRWLVIILLLCIVTLHVRVWIEIVKSQGTSSTLDGHPPREGVD